MSYKLRTETTIPRYSVSQFDASTFVVYDQREQHEVCICGNFDAWIDAEQRAQRIASLLNNNDQHSQD